ncbi:hypothetical protein E2562_012507, partial [Oryza meyeriana var. granulata]
ASQQKKGKHGDIPVQKVGRRQLASRSIKKNHGDQPGYPKTLPAAKGSRQQTVLKNGVQLAA